uniref:Uncharacterized protein n=1 Tax=Oryza brachyantha TaxID=4533 RepID=J3MTL6_ORYBR
MACIRGRTYALALFLSNRRGAGQHGDGSGRVSDMPLPSPICRRASSCHSASSLSLASGAATSPRPAPTLSVDAFNEIFLARYGCDLASLYLNEEEVQWLMLEYEAQERVSALPWPGE